MLGRRSADALGLERLPAYAFRESGLAESTIAADLPHLPNPLDFDGAKFAVVQLADLSFREIALLVDNTTCHKGVTMDIAMVAVGVRVM